MYNQTPGILRCWSIRSIPLLFFDHGAPSPGERIDRTGDGKVQPVPPALMERTSRGMLAIGRRIPLDHEVKPVLRNVSVVSEYPCATGLYKVEAQ